MPNNKDVPLIDRRCVMALIVVTMAASTALAQGAPGDRRDGEEELIRRRVPTIHIASS